MDLEEKYRNLEIINLISIIESGEDYTEKAKNIACLELKKRIETPEEITKIASELVHEKCKKVWENFSIFNPVPHPPKSNFLNNEEVLNILKEEYEIWGGKREDMAIDPWKYVIGAI